MADLLTSREFANNIVLIVVAFITGVLSPIVASWARAKFAEKKVVIEEEETDEILKMLHANEMIDQRIEAIRTEYNFDGVWIAQFHNGGSFYPSERVLNRFQKFSLTYEACKPGVASELSTIQNIPVTVFSAILKEVKEKGHYGINDVNEASDTTLSQKPFWCDRGVKSFHIVAIKCLKHKFLGFMVVDCTSAETPFNPAVVESLIIESKILGGYLVRDNDP